jgi:hypothetical protein
MTITTMDNDIKERLSIAYATAVAARAGCELTEVRVDRNGIDATIRAIRGTRVKIDVQLKATATIDLDQLGDDQFPFDLEVEAYNALRSTQIQAPQLLVVLILPKDPAQWLQGDETSLAFRRCAYWSNLYGRPPVDNESTIRVYLARAQTFHPESLRDLMNSAHEKALAGQTGI